MKGQIFGSFLTMMKLGPFKFAIYTMAYQELNRSTQYQWGEQPVFGGWDNLQFLGPGQDTQTLTGVIFPEYKGGTGQLNDLRDLGSKGQAHLMVSGTGKMLGYWVISQIDEGQTKFAALGVPRRQEFTITLRKYKDQSGHLGLMQSLRNAVGR